MAIMQPFTNIKMEWRDKKWRSEIRFPEDEIYDEKFDINQVKRLFHYVKPYRTQIALIAILMLSSSGLSMLIPTFFMKVMDDCIPMGMAGMKPILGYVAAILLITVYGMISLKLKIRYMSRYRAEYRA